MEKGVREGLGTEDGTLEKGTGARGRGERLDEGTEELEDGERGLRKGTEELEEGMWLRAGDGAWRKQTGGWWQGIGGSEQELGGSPSKGGEPLFQARTEPAGSPVKHVPLQQEEAAAGRCKGEQRGCRGGCRDPAWPPARPAHARPIPPWQRARSGGGRGAGLAGPVAGSELAPTRQCKAQFLFPVPAEPGAPAPP